jgi:hypothetical protein
MDRNGFAGAIRTFKARTPFRPFTVVTVIFDHEGVNEVVGDLASQPSASGLEQNVQLGS